MPLKLVETVAKEAASPKPRIGCTAAIGVVTTSDIKTNCAQPFSALNKKCSDPVGRAAAHSRGGWRIERANKHPQIALPREGSSNHTECIRVSLRRRF